MNKILRYSLMLLVAMLSTVSYAQTKIDFTANTITVTDKGFTLTASGFTFEAFTSKWYIKANAKRKNQRFTHLCEEHIQSQWCFNDHNDIHNVNSGQKTLG